MRQRARRVRQRASRALAAVATVSAAAAAASVGLSGPAAAVPAAGPPRAVVAAAYRGAARVVGRDSSGAVRLTVLLRSRDPGGLQGELASLYDPGSPNYGHWLTAAAFDARFGPAPAARAAVAGYLRRAGLRVGPGPSALLLTATGAARAVDAALHTSLATFERAGQIFHANTTPATLPAGLSGAVQAVVGLTGLRPERTDYRIAPRQVDGRAFGYGGGKDGSGLTPTQQIGMNQGSALRAKGTIAQGRHDTIALFELSGYTPADVTAWWRQYFRKRRMPRIVQIDVDGGPVHPACPSGDQCGPFEYSVSGQLLGGLDSADYSGDIEVEADLEEVLAMDPAARQIDVYNAPNDTAGTTELDEYAAIAAQDHAGVISSSWGECEYDATGDSSTPNTAMVQAEEAVFRQIAAQGQSLFAAAGDTGAFGCLRGSGAGRANVLDPASDPYVTGVGGTSYESYNPGSRTDPGYPAGSTTVWNVGDRCRRGQNTPTGACVTDGAGGGGDSTLWAAPRWELQVPRATNSYSTHTCGSSTTAGVAGRQLCREVPDIADNADENTPDSEYCSGRGAVVAGVTNPPGYPGDSTCYESLDPGPYWFGIGGTSLAAPQWAGVFGQAVGYHLRRIGLAADALFYLDHRVRTPGRYFADVTGTGKKENNNGLYPATGGYDQATGLGLPVIDNLVPKLP